jgi:outer membrane protein assembly factor BamB
MLIQEKPNPKIWRWEIKRMKRFLLCWAVLAFFPLGGSAQQVSTDPLDNWHQWRGPLATGEAVRGTPPLNWDEKTNVKWKTAIPGKSSATPIVWGQRVFTVTAVDTGKVAPPEDRPKIDPKFEIKTTAPKTYFEFIVMCFDRDTGKLIWKDTAAKAVPHEGIHPTHSYAAGSPTTDGKFLYVSFGSRGVHCYDLDGKRQWQKDFGLLHTRYAWGEASTPTVHKGNVILNWDHEGDSHLYVMDAKTGEMRWQVKRDERSGWSTPLVVEHQGTTQVIVNGTNKVRSYDLADGKLLWQCGGQTVNAIPSPVPGKGVVYCMSGYQGSAGYALALDGKGDLAKTSKVIWTNNQSTPYIPTPLLVGDRLYFAAKNTPLLSAVDAATGKLLFRERLPNLETLYASPTAAADRIYIVDRSGTTLVLEQADQFKVLAVNRLKDGIDGSPAVAGNQMFLRSHGHLYCLEEKK